MRIGAISYSGKATKLLAVLMICVLVFTLVIPPQPAEAVAATTVAAAGLTLAFLAACGIAFTGNVAHDSSVYWEDQIDSYLSDSGKSSVSDWVDFGSVVFDTVSRRFRFPGAVLSGLLDFLGWFTGKNEIEAGESKLVSSPNKFIVTSDGVAIKLGTATGVGTLSAGNFEPGEILYTSTRADEIKFSFDAVTCYFGFAKQSNGNVIWFSCYNYSNWQQEFDPSDYYSFSCVLLPNNCVALLAQNVDGSAYCRRLHPYHGFNFYTPSDELFFATASDTLGLPDLDEKEEELGYVPDVEIPLPEEVAEDTNIGDINDAANAVLDYVGTAGNTFYVNYEYVYEDTNVDTGTDEGTGEGTITDTETGTLTGTVALENVAADSLVEVKPEAMIDDETLTGLFVTKFPWCIPFDLYFAISAFAADPVTPEFEIDLFEGVSWDSLDLSGTEMTLSFESFEKVAAVTRWSTLIVFCAGLAMITKRMIWS